MTNIRYDHESKKWWTALTPQVMSHPINQALFVEYHWWWEHIYIEWGMIMTRMMIMMMAMMVTFCPTLWAIRISLTLVVMANVSNSFVRAAISYKLGPANYRRHHDDYCQSFVSIIMIGIFAAIISIIVFEFNKVNLLSGGSLEVGLRAFSWEIIGNTRSHLICGNLSYYIINRYYRLSIYWYMPMYYLWAARGSRRGADWDRLGSVPNLEKFFFLQLFHFVNPFFYWESWGRSRTLKSFSFTNPCTLLIADPILETSFLNGSLFLIWVPLWW